MCSPPLRSGLMVLVVTVLVLSAAVLTGVAWPDRAGADAASVTGPARYLALGGSASVGVQPTTLAPRGAPTDGGYADDLVAMEGGRWPGLVLTRLGCPGETTSTMLSGRDRCHRGRSSQLAEAVEFLRTDPSVRLVTVDLGFNDVRPCLRHRSVDTRCVAAGIDGLRRQLPVILSSLRSAAGPGVDIVGVGHYDPFLALAGQGAAGRSFAAASLEVIEQLDAALASIYARFSIPMAGVLQAFDAVRTGAAHDAVSAEVSRTCLLTWMCARPPYGPNLHPNDRGYRLMASAIAAALPPSG